MALNNFIPISGDTHLTFRTNYNSNMTDAEARLLALENFSGNHDHTVVDIDSDATISGYVITADGNGNATWEESQGGGGGGNGNVVSTTISGSTSNDTQKEIFVDAISGSRMTIPTDETWVFSSLAVARSTTESAGYKIEGVIKNDGGTVSLLPNAVKTVFAEEDTNWDITVSGNDTNNALSFLVIGHSGDSVNWNVTVNKTEVS